MELVGFTSEFARRFEGFDIHLAVGQVRQDEVAHLATGTSRSAMVCLQYELGKKIRFFALI